MQDARPVRDVEEERAERQRERQYRVVEIVDERTLRLDTGALISLLGIDVPPESRGAALDYLRRAVRGKAVLVRLDGEASSHEVLEEANGAPVPVYLLLTNKIFINRKMIEMGLAKADRSCGHRHSDKFIRAEAKTDNEGLTN